jgi:diguanylate cyclase (GGDEF)-like protein/PAS domain S-box-containing protein
VSLISDLAPQLPLGRSRDPLIRRLADELPTPLFATRDHHLAYVNRAFAELTGRGEAELAALGLADLAEPAARAEVAAWIAERRRPDAGPGSLAFALRHRDGRALWVEATAARVDLDGRPGLVGTLADATDRRAAEERSRESEAWFRTLTDTASIAIFVYDAERIHYVNRAAVVLTGFEEEEMLGMRPGDLIHPDFRALVAERIRARLRGEQVVSRYEIKMVTRRGERWVDVAAGQIPFRGGIALIGSSVDVTERKLAEERLEESRRRLDLAQRAARSLAWEWVIATDELVISGEPAQIFGVAPEVVARTGREFLEHLHPDDRERFAAATAAAVKGAQGDDLAIEIRMVLPGGRVGWLYERGLVQRDETGRGVRMIGVATDITRRKEAELALRESEERYRQMFEKHRAVKLLVDPGDAAIVDASPSAARFYGWSVEELKSMRVPQINTLPPAEIRSAMAAALAGEQDFFRFQHRLASGEVRDVEIESCPVDVHGRKLLYSIIHDVTERRRAEAALQEEKERAQVTLASIGDGVIRTDAAGRIDYLNPVAEKLTGWTLDEARGRRLTEVYQVVDGATRKPLLNPVAACLRGEPWVDLPGFPLLVRRDGAEYSIQDSAAPVRDHDGRIVGAVLVFKDVTELRGMEREMSYLATHDPLTGLLNRSEFETHLEARIAAAREGAERHALCYVDLDEFKVINDTCGHLAGDELLKQVAGVVRSAVRPYDTVARLGGDEFGVLLEGLDAHGGEELADRLHAALRRFRFHWRERVFEVGASVGLVPIGTDSGDLVAVLSAADAACYVAKESGRNRTHTYDPADRALAERHGEMQWIHRIHKAFDERRFCLYQQQIRALAGRPGAPPLAEIFIRMRAEDGSLTTPDAFIPAAERYHLIPSIDRWVVRSALAALRRRFARDLDDGTTAFAINLSGQSLGDEKFLEYVVAELNESGVGPERICFEITETAAIAHLARALRFISVLKEMGCRFVLDDFGSGLSSFAYLQNLQVDFLKIAGEFVRELADDEVKRTIVASAHQIAHVLKLRTIAEGVEEEATLAALERIGIDYAQGYLVGYPEPL